MMSTPDTPARASGPEPRPIAFPFLPESGQKLAAALRGARPSFVCVVAHTDTCLIPDISAAGATPELRAFTPAADAEALYYGRARCLPGVPSNPLGPPGPAVISVAALRLACIPVQVVDAGTRVRPQAPALVVGTQPGRDITSGRAVPHAADLFQRGLALGRRLASGVDYLVLGESVPGGTTTALAVLLALGYKADGKVSSSLGQNAHRLKAEVVQRALAASGLGQDEALGGRRSELGGPHVLHVLASVGDPMQPTVAGIALGALERVPVLLAGGTQMVAVLAAMRALADERGLALPSERLALATTRWVVADPTSDFTGLLAQVGPVPALCTNLSFASSRHTPLRRYEEFLVKEGVGAGGLAVAATLSHNLTQSDLLHEIERVYDEISGVRG